MKEGSALLNLPIRPSPQPRPSPQRGQPRTHGPSKVDPRTMSREEIEMERLMIRDRRLQLELRRREAEEEEATGSS